MSRPTLCSIKTPEAGCVPESKRVATDGLFSELATSFGSKGEMARTVIAAELSGLPTGVRTSCPSSTSAVTAAVELVTS